MLTSKKRKSILEENRELKRDIKGLKRKLVMEDAKFLSRNKEYKKSMMDELKMHDHIAYDYLEEIKYFLEDDFEFENEEQEEKINDILEDIYEFNFDEFLDLLDEYDISKLTDLLFSVLQSYIYRIESDMKYDNTLYRMINIPDNLSTEDFITKLSKKDYSSIKGISDGIGIYFANEIEGADTYWGDGGKEVTFVIEAPLNSVNLRETGLLTTSTIYDQEKEIRLKENSKVRLLSIIDEDGTEYDANFDVNTGSNDFMEKKYKK